MTTRRGMKERTVMSINRISASTWTTKGCIISEVSLDYDTDSHGWSAYLELPGSGVVVDGFGGSVGEAIEDAAAKIEDALAEDDG